MNWVLAGQTNMLGRRFATGLTSRPVAPAPPAFTPASLFAAGEQGVWYDPSDLTTMFEDSAGTTAVHTPGNGTADSPVGRILDKSGRGNHATQSTSTARPTLSARYNILVGTATLSTQSVTTVAATYTLSFSGTGTITLTGTKTGVYNAGTNTLTGVTAGTLTLTVAGTVTNADLRVSNDGVGLPAYQQVVNANTYDSAGFPYYLKADGVDDSLLCSSINFTATNAVSGFVGVRRLSNTSAQFIYSNGDNQGLTNGSFQLLATNAFASPAAAYNWSSRGTIKVDILVNESSYPAPRTNVVTQLANIATPVLTGRINGTQVATSSASQGTGNYGNLPFGVFYVPAGTPLYLNGRCFGMIIRGAASTATEITNTETWLNDKTKAY